MFPFTALLISVSTISGIAAFLALLMVIADATIGNYGEVTININSEKDILVRGGSSLLKTLMDEEIFIPSACGGRGSCGLCKVKAIDGLGAHLPTELPLLDEKERKENIRLSCQCKVKNDLKIKIPEELFSVRAFDVKLVKLRDLTHDIKELTLELPENSEIKFTAGQFIQFQVPEYELSDEQVYRAYSISSVPSDKRHVELEIRYVPEGICTSYVHKYLKEGDTITINGPYGDFYLRDTDRDMICIAGGSGMAPIKSILLDMKEKGIKRNVQYFFGARSKKDLFLLEEMQELEKAMPNFKFIPALSAPDPEDNWTGDEGLITKVVERFIKDGSQSEAYLCGSPGMINACMTTLTELGVKEELIYFDKFA